MIAAELAEARRLREEAARLLADYHAKAAGAEREAESILTEARAEAARFAEFPAPICRRRSPAAPRRRRTRSPRRKPRRCRKSVHLAADAAVAAAQKLIPARMDEQRAGTLIAAVDQGSGRQAELKSVQCTSLLFMAS